MNKIDTLTLLGIITAVALLLFTRPHVSTGLETV
jgi:hypothetical protein